MPLDAAATVALLYERTGDLVTPRRAGVVGEPFRAFLTVADDELLGGSVVGSRHRLQFPSAAGELDEGNEIEHAGASYRVLETSRRIRDGHESEAPLTPIPV